MSGSRCLWRRWCSGRRRARPPARSPHASFARSGRSRSPPLPSGPSGTLHTGGACAVVCGGASPRSPARPRRRPRAPQPGPSDPPAPSAPAALARLCVGSKPGQAPPPPTGTAAWPSGPSDALHTGGACVAVCGGASHRSPARPCRRPWVPQLGYPDPPAPSMPAVLPGFAIDRIARGYCTG